MRRRCIWRLHERSLLRVVKTYIIPTMCACAPTLRLAVAAVAPTQTLAGLFVWNGSKKMTPVGLEPTRKLIHYDLNVTP